MCLGGGEDEGNSKSVSSVVKVVHRKDYKPPTYLMEDVELDFKLDAEVTLVESTLLICAREATEEDLILDGESIELISVEIGGKKLCEGEYRIGNGSDSECLVIKKEVLPTRKPMKSFEVKIKNKAFPKANTTLSGLYASGSILCTQCEAEGYRRITYGIDRPDNMARFKVRLTSEKSAYPVLLSNGDSVSRTEYVMDGKTYHSELFVDPFKKPTYLFAIVAGPLEYHHDTFTTMATEDEPSREVDVYVYGEKKYMDQLHWALECTKKAMKWDEVKYGRVYDLSTFRVVCIDDFNAGAMENKSLTTYNVSCVIAHKDTRSDAAFMYVSQVIAHEYCHNWSGDRVTVRDWFQITLKEGFTNFRDHDFAEDHYSRACCRVSSVATLRSVQFPEDAGAMSHPIRPESYQTVDNFYTATVYDKGREVIRMYRVLVGEEGFRKGTDLYFKKYDGKAISCDEFRGAIAEANNIDLTQFERWYTQKGTPVVKVLEKKYNADTKTYHLKLQQIVPANALGDNRKGEPYHMPIQVGLIGKKSKKDLVGTKTLIMTEEIHKFDIENVNEDCVPSILRDFSAPVKLEVDLTNEELSFLMTYDSDPYNIWQANMTIFRSHIFSIADKILNEQIQFDLNKIEPLPENIAAGIEQHLNRTDLEFAAYCLLPEPVQAMMLDMKPFADPIALYQASVYVKKQIAQKFQHVFQQKIKEYKQISHSNEYQLTTPEIGRRRLLSTLMHYLTKAESIPVTERGDTLFQYMQQANNYTEREASFSLLVGLEGYNKKQDAIDWFYKRHHDNPTIVDNWVAIQCSVTSSDGMDLFDNVMKHQEMNGTCLNPNRFRAAIRTFANNVIFFHNPNGTGYQRFATEVVKYDKINPYTASICAKQLLSFQMFAQNRQQQIKNQLKWMSQQQISKNLREIVTRGLEA